jgi:hypothetical protein
MQNNETLVRRLTMKWKTEEISLKLLHYNPESPENLQDEDEA